MHVLQEFRWTLKSIQPVIDKRQLVIMVCDKDQFSRDDVISCVMIPFSKLVVASTIDSWLPIVRPMASLRWSAWSALQTRLLGQPAQAELKLRVTALKIGSDVVVANISSGRSGVGGWYGQSGYAEGKVTVKSSAKLVDDIFEGMPRFWILRSSQRLETMLNKSRYVFKRFTRQLSITVMTLHC